MEGPHVRKTSWDMNQEAFDLLMSRLDPDRETAGARYEEMRLMLIRLFENRNISAAADHADEVINRLTRKLIGGEDIQSLTAYALGVARHYLKEVPRRIKEIPIEDDDWPTPVPVSPPNEEHSKSRREECFMACLNGLKKDDREMILQYYEQEKSAKVDHRKALAERLGLTTITLRTRACRLRMKLELCIERCIAEPGT